MELLTYYVGQGACAVLRSDYEAIIIDAIFPSSNTVGAVILKQVLARDLARRNLVGLMLTSFDRDHADPRAVQWILNKYLPKWVMYPRYWKGSQSAADVMAAIRSTEVRRFGTPWELSREGIRLDKIPDRQILHLSEEFEFEVFSPHPADNSSSNNSSLVVKISRQDGDGFSHLVTGDTEQGRWESIRRYFRKELDADVLAAPHHGSKHGIDENTLSWIDPHTVLISCGIGNQHGHPDDEAIDAYEAIEAEVYCTGYDGNSFITYLDSDGDITTDILDE